MLGVGYVKEEPVMAGDRPQSAVPVFGAIPGTGGSFSSPDGNFSFFRPPVDENDPGPFFTQPNDDYGFFVPTPGVGARLSSRMPAWPTTTTSPRTTT